MIESKETKKARVPLALEKKVTQKLPKIAKLPSKETDNTPLQSLQS